MNPIFFALAGLLAAYSSNHAFAQDFRQDIPYDVRDEQVGEEWSRPEANDVYLAKGSEALRAAARMTARYGATAFYLGKFNGKHLMATANHVLAADKCKKSAVFTVLKKSYPCESILGRWPEVELGLFSIKVPAEDEALLKTVGRNFAWNHPITHGQELMTLGFGSTRNPGMKKLTVNQDRDCKVFSGDDEFEFLHDPDPTEDVPYRVWSFASGCDISNGDSGAPTFDRNDGALLGIMWTIGFPRKRTVQNEGDLSYLFKRYISSYEIWTDLTYASAAPKIREYLRKSSQDPALSDELRQTLSDLVENRSQ